MGFDGRAASKGGAGIESDEVKDMRLDYESPPRPPPDGPWNFFTAIGCTILIVVSIAGVFFLVLWIFFNPMT